MRPADPSPFARLAAAALDDAGRPDAVADDPDPAVFRPAGRDARKSSAPPSPQAALVRGILLDRLDRQLGALAAVLAPRYKLTSDEYNDICADILLVVFPADMLPDADTPADLAALYERSRGLVPAAGLDRAAPADLLAFADAAAADPLLTPADLLLAESRRDRLAAATRPAAAARLADSLTPPARRRPAGRGRPGDPVGPWAPPRNTAPCRQPGPHRRGHPAATAPDADDEAADERAADRAALAAA